MGTLNNYIVKHVIHSGIKYSYKTKHLEAWFWITAIIILAFSDPVANGHSSLCLIKQLNLGFCPGCGLGHSIAWIFRGEIIKSFQSHPFGIPAIIILMTRSFSLLKDGFSIHQTNNKTS